MQSLLHRLSHSHHSLCPACHHLVNGPSCHDNVTLPVNSLHCVDSLRDKVQLEAETQDPADRLRILTNFLPENRQKAGITDSDSLTFQSSEFSTLLPMGHTLHFLFSLLSSLTVDILYSNYHTDTKSNTYIWWACLLHIHKKASMVA